VGSTIIFVKKKDGTLKLCLYYRELNKISVKNKCPLPTIDNCLNQLRGMRVFLKIDLTLVYHQLRIKSEDIPKMMFRTHYDHYKLMVMLLGLTNASDAFMDFMNRVFRLFLDKFVIIFIDDILMYLKTKEEHTNHLRIVL